MDKREKVARAIARSGLIPASREWKELLPETRDHYMQQADAAIAALEPVTDGPDWEGFGRDLLESWPVRDVDGAELFDAALRNRLIREIPGGYDPEQHIDADGICPEPGDPWYEYAFRAQEDTQ